MSGIGHNLGPSLDGATGWRRHCWGQARAALLPHLPIEVVRLRVRRAAELGLDYKTYAGVRATTGRDLVAFLFSSNALDLRLSQPALGEGNRVALARMAGCDRIMLVQAPLSVDAVRASLPVMDALHPAPGLLAPHRVIRADLRAALGSLPADAVLLVGASGLEQDWCAAGRLAGYLSADRFFPGTRV